MIKILTTVFSFAVFSLVAVGAEPSIPDSWKAEWDSPSAAMRPLQIIHGGVVHYDTPEKMAYFKDQCGLGGIVCNVGSNNYLYNDEEWKRFVDAVKSARQLGLRVWIYDEDGYPSPEAGGVVLRGHPEMECQSLVYDAQRKDEPLYVRPAYEFTHASNNYAAARRYPNLLDTEATKRFLEVTHSQYRDRLGEELFSQIEAFFTDEPSLNAVNIGTIPEDVRVKVRVDDPLDPNVKPLPMVPWCNDLPQRYQEKYGEDLMPLRMALFVGDSEKDKAVRQKFWELISDLDRDRFYGLIQQWCRENGSSVPTPETPTVPLRVASSGHTLHEEPTHAHVPLDGNKLEMLMKLDVPGLDMLNSDPKAVIWGAWRAAAFPASAAYWTNRRLVMTEISDFSQQMGGQGEVDLETMCAAASWQAALGVTEFTLYYGIKGRGEDVHKEYCQYIGRLNAILRDAAVVPEAVLYYPIRELQAEYLPQADPLDLQKMSPETKRLVSEFEGVGAFLVHHQIPFVLSDKRLTPQQLDDKAFVVNGEDAKKLAASDVPKIAPENGSVVLGRFRREGRDIFLLLNTEATPYEGTLTIPGGKSESRWCQLDPADGEIRDAGATENVIPVKLGGRKTLIFVGE